MNFLVQLVLVELSFGRVVVWLSCLLVELVLVDLSWSSCRLVELSHIPIIYNEKVDKLGCLHDECLNSI
jgi:hypothetical protein